MNDTLSCFGKPKGSVTMSQKITVLFNFLLGDFWQKLYWGYIYPLPPVAGTRVKCTKWITGTDKSQTHMYTPSKHQVAAEWAELATNGRELVRQATYNLANNVVLIRLIFCHLEVLAPTFYAELHLRWRHIIDTVLLITWSRRRQFKN